MSGDRFYAVLIGLSGWRSWAVAGLLGAIGSLAFAPTHMVPALVPALTGLLLFCTSAASIRAAFIIGWWFGFGHFVTGFYWVGNSFVVADVGILAGFFAVVALAATAALSVALVGVVCNVARLSGVFQVVLFASLWTFVEWGRSFFILGGFPWNLIGYAWGFSDNMIQLAAVTGVFGVSAVTVFCAASPVTLVMSEQTILWRRWVWIGAAAVGLSAIWAGGALRLSNASLDVVEDVRLRIVQANISQHHKWLPDLREIHFDGHLTLTQVPAKRKITHVIWPETATPYALEWNLPIREIIGSATPPGGLLITGAVGMSDKREEPLRIWNSLHALSFAGDIVGSYNKMRLVPFGEYVPLRDWLPFVKLVHGSRDYSRGTGQRTLDLPGLPSVGPLICFEAIFPGDVVDKSRRPEWLLNLTNDAWYGNSAGPYQHLVQTKFRSVEEGLPLIRAANTGISAAIDAYGRVIATLELGETGVLDTALPMPLIRATFYSQHGNIPILFFVVLLVAVTLVGGAQRRTLGE